VSTGTSQFHGPRPRGAIAELPAMPLLTRAAPLVLLLLLLTQQPAHGNNRNLRNERARMKAPRAHRAVAATQEEHRLP